MFLCRNKTNKKFKLIKMKKVILSMLALATLTFTSCSSDDTNINDDIITNPVTGPTTTFAGETLQGVITTKIELKSDVKYKLPGSLLIANGGELTIPAGTKIQAEAADTSTFVAVLKGGKIFINGTNDNPVVISSENGEQGDWGGLVICGKANTTEGVDATAEIGGFVYGGEDNEDNSGTIENLVLRGTGAAINSDSEYNGISFYAVGSKTVVNNIAVINGADDGVEFFGGTVNVNNLYLENNNDDSVDWTEGWNGTVINTYISHTKSGFSTAFEADGSNGNPKFNNVTAVSTVNGTALQFKKTSGATITNLKLEGYAVDLDLREKGALSDVQIEGADAKAEVVLDAAKLTYTLDATQKGGTAVDISTWAFRNGSL